MLPHSPTPTTFKNLFRIGLTTLFFTLVTWSWMGWKGVFSFFPLWALFEVYFRVRARSQIPCPHCGFDPYLFMVDTKLAKKEVESFWRDRFRQKGIPYPGDTVHEQIQEFEDGDESVEESAEREDGAESQEKNNVN